MNIKLENKELNYYYPGSPNNYVFIRGRTKKPLIELPNEWEEFVDLSTITVHLTQIGANQNIIVKRIQGLEVHLQTNSMPVDCFYLIMGEVLDSAP